MAYDEFDENGTIDYGYILFAKTPAGDHSVLILESNLLSIIRNLWYNQSYVHFSNKFQFSREQLILLISYIDDAKYQLFNRLFPQYKTEFDRFSKLEAQLVQEIF